MPIDTFTQEEFLAALPAGSHNDGTSQGEFVFYTPIDTRTGVTVRSSIRQNGVSAGTGEDSIRMVLVGYAGELLAVGIDKFTNRTEGWAERMNLKIEQLRQLRLAAGNCDECDAPMHIYKSKTDRNPGRLFAKCTTHNGFHWLDDDARESERNAQLEYDEERHGKLAEAGTTSTKFDKIIDARRPGTCPWCHKPISIGERIGVKDKAWGHVECPTREPVTATVTSTRSTGSSTLDSSALIDAISSIVSDESVQPAQVVAKPFIPSRYQQAIFDFMQGGEGNAVVEAVAGSGKTTTIVQALQYIPTDSSAAFLAFNKHIAKELKGKAPSHVQVSTVHSLGFSDIRASVKGVRVEEHKLGMILDRWLPTGPGTPFEERSANRITQGVIRKVADLVRSVSLDWHKTVRDTNELDVLVEHYGIETNGEWEAVVKYLERLLKADLAMTNVIDYDDMIWMPVAANMPTQKFEWLFVDEAQDLNKVQIEFVLRSIAPGGRVIAVGDRWQSLYGFRGADTDAIPNLIEALHATVLPLSITYRCPKSHVTIAQQYVGQIEPRENAPEGKVVYTDENKVLGMLAAGDMVICRVNAPIVPLAFALIRKGIKATVRGRDFCKGLVDLVNKFKADSLVSLESRLLEYQQRETERLLRQDKLSQLQQVEDKVDTLIAVMAECDTVAQVLNKLDSLFSDDVEGVVLSSIHRAKGLEADRVFILHPELMPHPRAKQAWQKQQEMNCLYVAVTRSKSELYYVEKV